jgi:hypothetical protein
MLVVLSFDRSILGEMADDWTIVTRGFDVLVPELSLFVELSLVSDFFVPVLSVFGSTILIYTEPTCEQEECECERETGIFLRQCGLLFGRNSGCCHYNPCSYREQNSTP